MNFADTLLNIAHEQLTGNTVQEADAEQQHTGAEQAHNHIPCRRHDRPAILPDHDQSTGGNRIDFHKYISGEQVIRIDQRQKGRQQKIHHNIVEIPLGLLDLLLPLPHAAEHGKQHNQTEKDCHDRFEYTDPYLVAPRSRKMPHLIDVIRAVFQDKCKHRRIHRTDKCDHCQVQTPRCLSAKDRGERAGEQRHNDAKEGEILNKRHHRPSFSSCVVISSRFKV